MRAVYLPFICFLLFSCSSKKWTYYLEYSVESKRNVSVSYGDKWYNYVPAKKSNWGSKLIGLKKDSIIVLSVNAFFSAPVINKKKLSIRSPSGFQIYIEDTLIRDRLILSKNKLALSMGYVYSLSDSDSLISLTGGYKLSCPWERQMSLKNTALFDVYELN